jgi:hypothetical protein
MCKPAAIASRAQAKFSAAICAAGAADPLLVDCPPGEGELDPDDLSPVRRDVAANANTSLGLLVWQQGGPANAAALDLALRYMQAAVELSDHPDELAIRYTWLADIYRLRDDCEQAEEMLNQAADEYDHFIAENPHLRDPRYEQFHQDAWDEYHQDC